MKIIGVWALSLCSVWALSQEDLQKELETALKKSGAPAMTVAVFDAEKILARAEAGVREMGKKKKVGPDDHWHIGSDGKAITATLIARLVEQKKLSWETPVASLFGNAAEEFHPQARKITMLHLLSHTAGLEANPSNILRSKSRASGARRVRDHRLEVLREALTGKPLSEPGSKYAYSNVGYIVAGAVVEKILKMDWEKAMEQEVFKPLGMKSVGYGAPSGRKHPRGHSQGTVAGESYAGDNPAIYGPAGGMHLSVEDWVTFLQDQLQGRAGKGKLLKKESYEKLHTPVKDGYACGWGVVNGRLAHDGSNTMWYASVLLIPDKGRGVFAIANAAGGKTSSALRDVMKKALR